GGVRFDRASHDLQFYEDGGSRQSQIPTSLTASPVTAVDWSSTRSLPRKILEIRMFTRIRQIVFNQFFDFFGDIGFHRL
uniref:hypothetical protein n=1 Tax=Haloferax volcanii TaxID=2246 RepID=UPI0016437724